MQINDNGVITFGTNFEEQHTPRALPLEGSFCSTRMIAPYWADTDTRGTGNVFYRQTSNSILLTRATSEIRRAFAESQNVTITNLVIETWDAVGYFDEHADKVCLFVYIFYSEILNPN